MQRGGPPLQILSPPAKGLLSLLAPNQHPRLQEALNISHFLNCKSHLVVVITRLLNTYLCNNRNMDYLRLHMVPQDTGIVDLSLCVVAHPLGGKDSNITYLYHTQDNVLGRDRGRLFAQHHH